MGRRFLFPAFRYKLKQPAWPSSWNLYRSSWALRPWDLDWNHTLGSLVPAKCRSQTSPPPPECEPNPYNKSISPLIYILLVLLLWGNLIQSPSQKEKKKMLSNQWYKACNWWRIRSKEPWETVSSLEPLFKLRRLNYLGDYQLPRVDWSIFLASESPSTLGLSELDGFSCRGMGQEQPQGMLGKCAKHAPISLCSSLPASPISSWAQLSTSFLALRRKENTTTYSHPPGVNREWWCGKFGFSSSHIHLGFLNFSQRIMCLFNQQR